MSDYGSDVISIEEESLIDHVEEKDVVAIQTQLVMEMQNMLVDDFEKQKSVLELGKEVLASHHLVKCELADEFDDFIRRARRSLVRNFQLGQTKVHEFGAGLKRVLHLYVEVNNRMRVDEKQAAKQDAFIEQIEKNELELNDLKENIIKLKDFFDEDISPVPSLTSVKSDKSEESNQISETYKPIEAELATHAFHITTELGILIAQLPSCTNFPKLVPPIIAQTEKVVDLVFRENPPKDLDEFLETLPDNQKD